MQADELYRQVVIVLAHIGNPTLRGALPVHIAGLLSAGLSPT